jgi:choline dehydrogenase-like flavoprotein
VKEARPWTVHLGGFGECLPQFENRAELDKHRVDAWGIPVLHISMAWSDNERAMMEDMRESAAEMLEAAGAENITSWANIAPPGLAIHEVGTARMGNDPHTSVLNRWQQAHDVPNLFVMDGSCYPSSACQNPTVTIMALASRACDYLVEQFRTSNL